MSSMILYKQMAVSSLGKIFSVSPNVRLEPVETVKTARHLGEFRQVDVEMALASYDDAMRLAERLLVFVVKDVKEKCFKGRREVGKPKKYELKEEKDKIAYF